MTSDPTNDENPADPNEAPARRPTLDMISDAATSVRRLEGKEDLDADGLRTIWHRGRKQIEMLTWENADEEIQRQELSIFGMVVEFKRGQTVRTGHIPLGDEISAGDAKPMSAMVEMDEVADAGTLELAGHLLKNFEDRDRFSQHLLRVINLTIADLGYDDGQTAVGQFAAPQRLEGDETQQLNPHDIQQRHKIREEARQRRDGAPNMDQTAIMTMDKRSNTPVILLGIGLGLAGVGLGLLVSYLLGVL